MNYYTFAGGCSYVSILADYRVDAKIAFWDIFGDVPYGVIVSEGRR